MRHGDNPVLRVQASQTSVKVDRAGNIVPIKGDGKKTWYRIDGIVAAVMALGRCMQMGTRSVYETRGSTMI